MDTEVIGGLLTIIALISLLVGTCAFASYMTYTGDDFSNKIDVCQHLTNVSTSYSVPKGQTVYFYYAQGGQDDQFAFWLQAMSQHNITNVYAVPKGDWGFTYRGVALYFEYEEVIYLYQ